MGELLCTAGLDPHRPGTRLVKDRGPPGSCGAPRRKATGTKGATRGRNQVQAHSRGLDFAASTASRDAAVSGGRSRVRGHEATGTVRLPGLTPPCQRASPSPCTLSALSTGVRGFLPRASSSSCRPRARGPNKEPGDHKGWDSVPACGFSNSSGPLRAPSCLRGRKTSPLETRGTQRPGRTSEFGAPKLPWRSSSTASKPVSFPFGSLHFHWGPSLAPHLIPSSLPLFLTILPPAPFSLIPSSL